MFSDVLSIGVCLTCDRKKPLFSRFTDSIFRNVHTYSALEYAGLVTWSLSKSRNSGERPLPQLIESDADLHITFVA